MHDHRLLQRSWSTALGRVALGAGVGGLVLVASATAAPQAASSLQIALHPNHLAAKPGGGSGSPSTFPGWASSNWSGYAATTASSTPFTGITGHWKVPSVSASSGATYSADWIGLDGFANNSLIQTGTEQDFYSGSGHYGAWWTTSSQNFEEQTINEPVSPGDPMTATISGSGTSWSMTLADTSSAHPWSFTEPVTYTGPRTSAEWVVEAPTVGGRIASLAHYLSPTTFDPGTVDGGSSPNLVASDGGELVQGSGHRTVVVSIPSTPDSDHDGFNISYGSAAPAPPSS